MDFDGWLPYDLHDEYVHLPYAWKSDKNGVRLPHKRKRQGETKNEVNLYCNSQTGHK